MKEAPFAPNSICQSVSTESFHGGKRREGAVRRRTEFALIRKRRRDKANRLIGSEFDSRFVCYRSNLSTIFGFVAPKVDHRCSFDKADPSRLERSQSMVNYVTVACLQHFVEGLRKAAALCEREEGGKGRRGDWKKRAIAS
jgi:hypothetical protein